MAGGPGRSGSAAVHMTKLTPTSYLILGILATREWSAYELAEQLDKGLTEVWPRARRQLYNAPKQLVEHGLANASREPAGARHRTIYSITESGRAALRDWLSTDARPPALEFEGMLHVLLADQGSLEDLERTLEQILQQARARLQLFEAHAEFIRTTGGGTFPERQHLFALSSHFMIGHFTHIADWAGWALTEVRTWPDTTTPPSQPR
jgi:PadR family transcriptional regulator AphA